MLLPSYTSSNPGCDLPASSSAVKHSLPLPCIPECWQRCYRLCSVSVKHPGYVSQTTHSTVLIEAPASLASSWSSEWSSKSVYSTGSNDDSHKNLTCSVSHRQKKRKLKAFGSEVSIKVKPVCMDTYMNLVLVHTLNGKASELIARPPLDVDTHQATTPSEFHATNTMHILSSCLPLPNPSIKLKLNPWVP